MSRWEGHHPKMWASGGEDMTEPQTQYLRGLSYMMRVKIPFIVRADRNGQRVSKAEASILITKLQHNEIVTQEYLLSLGRTEAPVPPEHPSRWINCHKPMTPGQQRWIEDITEQLGIPSAVTQKGTLGLTRGQAAWLLTILRKEKDEIILEPRDRTWLDRAVTLAVEEVPLPDEIDDPDYEPSDDEEWSDESDEDADVEVIPNRVRKRRVPKHEGEDEVKM